MCLKVYKRKHTLDHPLQMKAVGPITVFYDRNGTTSKSYNRVTPFLIKSFIVIAYDCMEHNSLIKMHLHLQVRAG